MKQYLIATCQDWPDGNADLRTLAQAIDGELIPWQAIHPAQCRDAVILPLAVWDYSANPAAYRAWLDDLQRHGVSVYNPPALQRWNMDKRYLIELAEKYLPITPCMALTPEQDWQQALAQCPWHNPVVKPLIGQSGRGVRRLQEGTPTKAEYPDGILLQTFVDAPFGEVCLVYVNGEFSHAAHRKPPADEWRANSAYGVEILPIKAQDAWLQVGKQTIAALPYAPLYARVDGLVDNNGKFHLNEVEVIEPALYLSTDPQALARLVAAIEKTFP